MTDLNTSCPAPSLTQRQGLFYALMFTSMMVLCFAVPRALSFLPALIGVGGLVFYYCKNRVWPVCDKKLLGFFCALAALALLSSLWSPDMGYSFGKALKSVVILFAGYALILVFGKMPQLERSGIVAVTGGVCCALAAILIYEEYRSGFFLCRLALQLPEEHLPPSIRSGFLLNRSILFVELMSLPVLLGLYYAKLKRSVQYGLMAAILIGIGLALSETRSQTSQIAAVMIFCMAIYPSHLKIARKILMVCVVAGIMAAPFFAKPAYKAFFETATSHLEEGIVREASIPHRLEVWKFVSEQIALKPFIGHGLEATRFLRAGYIMPNMQTDQVLHPHNAVLQIWVEFGLIGALLTCVFAVFLLRKLDGLPPLLQRYYAMIFMVLLGVMAIGYGLWQAWQLGMVMGICAYSILVTRMGGLCYSKSNDMNK